MGASADLQRIHMQIMWNRLIAVVEEQAQTLMRSAFSSIVRECGDLSAGVFDTKGRMLAQAVTGTPGHVNSMAESVKHFIAHFGLEAMQPGDIYITNDPWQGTGHLNDFVLTTPCFRGDELIALFSCTSHLVDIGGIGYGPDAKDVFMEGLYIPMLKLADRGVMNETLLAMVRANSRTPTETEGDVYSLAACNDIGCARLLDMMGEFELADLDALAEHICETSRAAVLQEIRKLPPGTYRSSMWVDGYDREVDLVATTTVTDQGIHVDYDGTSLMSEFGINVPLAYTTAYTCFGLSCIVSAQIPNNAGSLSPLTVSAPEGSILNASYPNPVAIRHVIGQMLPDVVFGCLRQAVPDRVPAEGASCLWSVTMRGRGDRSNQKDRGYTINAVTNGGTGARPTKDGLSATAYPSGVRGTPVEIIESIAPLVVWQKELRPESGGPGRHRGGHGQLIEIASHDDRPFEVLAAFDRIKNPARGSDGGRNGANGYIGLASGGGLEGKGTQEVPAGDRLVIHTPGGGGTGDPQQRDPAALRREIRDGLLTEQAATRDYGLTAEEDAGGPRG